MEIDGISSMIKSIGRIDLSFSRVRSSVKPPFNQEGPSLRNEKSSKTMIQEAEKDPEKNVEILASNIQKVLQKMNYSLQFQVDSESNRVIMKVLNHKGEIIREIPPEELVHVARNLPDIEELLLNSKEG